MNNQAPKGCSLLFKGEENGLSWKCFSLDLEHHLDLKFLGYVSTPNIYSVSKTFLSSYQQQQVKIIILSMSVNTNFFKSPLVSTIVLTL